MYTALREIHAILGILSLVTFFVLTIYFIYLFFSNKKVKKLRKISLINIWVFHTQFVVGIIQYFVSPLVSSFLDNPSEQIKIKDIRFFSMEHPVVMLVLILFLTLFNSSIKKDRHRSAFVYLLFAIFFMVYAFPYRVFL